MTNVVESEAPFHRTTALEPNPLPFTVNVKLEAPAVIELGLSDVIFGDWQNNLLAEHTNNAVSKRAGRTRRPVIGVFNVH